LYFFINMSNLNYVTNDTRYDMTLSDDGLDSYFGKSEEERETDDSGATNDSDAYVYEGLDEPNYISADHGYYPDLSSWRLDLEASSDGKMGSDERSISTLQQYLSNLSSFDHKKAEMRVAETRARCKALHYVLGDDSDESDNSVANA
jgi:hypothetical protein